MSVSSLDRVTYELYSALLYSALLSEALCLGEAKIAATTINVVNRFSTIFPKLFTPFQKDCIDMLTS